MLRWSLKLQEYNFHIEHRPGTHHTNADTMSRIPYHSEVQQAIAALDYSSSEVIREQQLRDPLLQPIISYLETGTLPEDSSEARNIVASSSQYFMKNGFLSHLWDCNLARQRPNLYCQMVLPVSMRNEILTACHDDVLSGHLGFKKTYHKLRERFFWPSMYSDCEFWCKSCTDCSTRKTPKSLAKAPLLPIPSSYPFETLAVDVLGPFPTSLQGNRFIIVFTDTFTR